MQNIQLAFFGSSNLSILVLPVVVLVVTAVLLCRSHALTVVEHVIRVILCLELKEPRVVVAKVLGAKVGIVAAWGVKVLIFVQLDKVA